MRRILTALGLSLALALTAVGAYSASAAPASAGTVVVQIDNPSQGEQNMTPTWIAGWAVDTAAPSGTGITSVSVYIDGDQNTGRLLGQANYGGDRPDVASALGNPNFRYSGFTFNLAGINIQPGTPHTFTVVANSVASGTAVASVSGVTLSPQSNPAFAAPNTGTTAPSGYAPMNPSGYGYGTMTPPQPPYAGQYPQQYGYQGQYPPYGYQSYTPTPSDANGLPIIGNAPYGQPLQPVYYDSPANYYGGSNLPHYGTGYGYYGNSYGYYGSGYPYSGSGYYGSYPYSAYNRYYGGGYPYGYYNYPGWTPFWAR